MEKHFNTAGPSKADLHYIIEPLSRVDLAALRSLIAQQRYFVLHAPRQTGKTTCLQALQVALNSETEYTAVYANIEAAQAARSNVAEAMGAIVSVLSEKFEELGIHCDSLVEAPFDALRRLLRKACAQSVKPVVLLLDEADALVGDTLISLLRQIRAGYTDRPKSFPQTIVLCGVRDVRDYRMTMPDGEVITGGSAFNIKAESLRLGDFSRDELVALYQQHTESTGQRFDEAAIELAWQSTQGQPWLVNALAEQAVWKTPESLDRNVVIDLERMRAAREALILRNDTHLDQLTDKLREERVRRVIEPMLMGGRSEGNEADEQYVIDLGLVRYDRLRKTLMPANEIYTEVLPRVLSHVAQSRINDGDIKVSWQDASGKLDAHQFLLNFLDFWRNHGEVMMQSAPYHEAAPHLVLMAYLQRVINGGGRIEREYAAGSGRLDLLVLVGDRQMAIEVKVWRDKQADPLAEGLVQIEAYLTRLGLKNGFLVIFDRRTNAVDWPLRMQTHAERTASGRAVQVLRG